MGSDGGEQGWMGGTRLDRAGNRVGRGREWGWTGGMGLDKGNRVRPGEPDQTKGIRSDRGSDGGLDTEVGRGRLTRGSDRGSEGGLGRGVGRRGWTERLGDRTWQERE